MRAAFERYDVVWFGVDPSPAKDDTDEALYWLPTIDGWHRDFAEKLPVWATPGAYGNSVLFDMRLSQSGGVRRNQAFTLAAEMVARWIDEDGLNGPLRHDGSPILRTHVHNARRRPNQWGVSLAKVTRDSNKLVDLAVCMVGAVMGAREALDEPAIEAALHTPRIPTTMIVLAAVPTKGEDVSDDEREVTPHLRGELPAHRRPRLLPLVLPAPTGMGLGTLRHACV